MTAVKWLYSKMYENYGRITIEEFEQALEMEKQQIMNAYYDGSYDYPLRVGDKEQYYNENFKK